ncbi:hypothetical protein Nepgr_008162 [Nepenthes gracilis]|uniref:Uncharacterized protein n=1 Tax=Nepenthes gracilis TaxID=150966 RepID=A0AAD3S889_NEPGR|nr:hypothetical protein Nepgr_008162 [Nepenthes gracilis]
MISTVSFRVDAQRFLLLSKSYTNPPHYRSGMMRWRNAIGDGGKYEGESRRCQIKRTRSTRDAEQNADSGLIAPSTN